MIPVGIILILTIGQLWRAAGWVWRFVGPSRFSAFTILIGGVLLLLTAQGKELTADVGNATSAPFILLLVAVIWLSIQAWYWARTTLVLSESERNASILASLRDKSSGEDRSWSDRNWKTWLPDAYLLVLVLAVWYGLYSRGDLGYLGIAFLLGSICLALVFFRDRSRVPIDVLSEHSGVADLSDAEKARHEYLKAERRRRSALVWKLHLPRLYAVIPFAVACAALWMQGHTHLIIFVLVAAVITLALIVMRRSIVSKLASRLPQFAKYTSASATAHPGVEYALFKTPLANVIMFFVSIGLALVMAFVFVADPLTYGQIFGAAAIAFFAFSAIIPIGSGLIWASNRIGFPLLSTLLLAAIVFSLFNDNHVVQTFKEETKPSARLSVKQALEKWLQANPERADGKPTPLVLVSTAGGGLRAAYWTATVLGRLQDSCSAFSSNTFSISAVSGGSVGASVFAARMTTQQPETLSDCGQELRFGTISEFATQALSKDFLGPTVASLLFSDLLQRFSPKAWFESRGHVLADSWSDAWSKTCASDDGCRTSADLLDQPFLDFAPKANSYSWQPALFLNATHQESGKRLIAGHLKVTRDVFFDAYDSHQVLKRDIALKTAALNSARFTYVSPPGLLLDPDHKSMGHVLDGGYFENNGAITTAEILLKLVELLGNSDRRVRPIIIQITSDPGLGADDYPDLPDNGDNNFLPLNQQAQSWGNEVLGPIRGILKTRSARGVLAAKTTAEITQLLSDRPDWVKSVSEPVFAHFEMCVSSDSDPKPPLGWAMSEASRQQIKDMVNPVSDTCDNAAQFSKVLAALNQGGDQ
ncbi:MAG: hypothetical protein ABJM29_00185 [Rhizobiaceae bacterium]